MECPQCGCKLPDGAWECPACRTLPARSKQRDCPEHTHLIPQTSDTAVAALIVSLFGCMLPYFSPIAAVVLGIVALVKMNKLAVPMKGRGVAIAAMAIAVADCLLFPWLFQYFMLARTPPVSTCINNQRTIAMAMLMYDQDHQGRFPSHLTDALEYLGNNMATMHCLTDHSAAKISYGYNLTLCGIQEDRIIDPTSLLCTADGGNAAHLIVTRKDIALRHKENSGYVASFTDGHARYLKFSEIVHLNIEETSAHKPHPAKK